MSNNENDFLLIEGIEGDSNEQMEKRNKDNCNKKTHHIVIPTYYSKVLAFENIYYYCTRALIAILVYAITAYIRDVCFDFRYVPVIGSVCFFYFPFALIKIYWIIQQAYLVQLNLAGKIIIDIVFYSIIILLSLAIGVFCINILFQSNRGNAFIILCLLLIHIIALFTWLVLFIGFRKLKKTPLFVYGLLFLLWLCYLIGYLSICSFSINADEDWSYYFFLTWLIGNSILIIIAYPNVFHMLIDICISSSVVLFIIDSESLITNQGLITHSKYYAGITALILLLKLVYDKSRSPHQSSSNNQSESEWRKAVIG